MRNSCIIVFCLFTLLLLSCNNNQKNNQPQFEIHPEDTIMMQFDIETFNLNKIDHPYFDWGASYKYIAPNEVIIEQHETGQEYVEKRIYPDKMYYELFVFYLNGNLQWKCKYFKSGRVPIGRKIYYDEEGNIINIEDTDAPYKMTLDEVIKFAEQEMADLDEKSYTLARGEVTELDISSDEAFANVPVGSYFWAVNISLPRMRQREIVLNADNGEVVYDKIPADDYINEE